MKFVLNIHVPLRMSCITIHDPLIFALTPLSGQNLVHDMQH